MHIKFKTIYGPEAPLIMVQKELLRQWATSCEECQMKFIQEANIIFNDYSMPEYPNQKQLKKEYSRYLATFNPDLSDENVANCFKEFAKQYRVLELVITPEDYE